MVATGVHGMPPIESVRGLQVPNSRRRVPVFNKCLVYKYKGVFVRRYKGGGYYFVPRSIAPKSAGFDGSRWDRNGNSVVRAVLFGGYSICST